MVKKSTNLFYCYIFYSFNNQYVRVLSVTTIYIFSILIFVYIYVNLCLLLSL